MNVPIIGVARVLMLGRGTNVKPLSTYTLSKSENSPDLAQYFLGGARNSHLEIKKWANARTERTQRAPQLH